MKVLKICFVFEEEQWDDARSYLSEDEVRSALIHGGMTELTRLIGIRQDAELEDILEERDE